jgi:hypothetical protein
MRAFVHVAGALFGSVARRTCSRWRRRSNKVPARGFVGPRVPTPSSTRATTLPETVLVHTAEGPSGGWEVKLSEGRSTRSVVAGGLAGQTRRSHRPAVSAAGHRRGTYRDTRRADRQGSLVLKRPRELRPDSLDVSHGQRLSLSSEPFPRGRAREPNSRPAILGHLALTRADPAVACHPPSDERQPVIRDCGPVVIKCGSR